MSKKSCNFVGDLTDGDERPQIERIERMMEGDELPRMERMGRMEEENNN